MAFIWVDHDRGGGWAYGGSLSGIFESLGIGRGLIQPSLSRPIAPGTSFTATPTITRKPDVPEVPMGEYPLESGLFDTPLPDLSSVFVGPVGGRKADSSGTATWDSPVLVPEEEDIEWGPGIYENTSHQETDWDEFYREYEILNPEPGQRPRQTYENSTDTSGDDEVAIDWGEIISGAIDIAQNQVPGRGAQIPWQNFTGPVAPSAPRTVTVDTVTGEVKKCSRRRRRRLLTPTDLSDLAALAAVVGKGDALKLAVAKAVRR